MTAAELLHERVPTTTLSSDRCHLGEGPAYDAGTNTAWWFDILERKLYEAKLGTGEIVCHSLPFMASALAYLDDARQLASNLGIRTMTLPIEGVMRAYDAALKEVARRSAGGLTFHQLRHSYATWLVSDGVPVNDVQRLMGHSRASTTLDLYTHIRTTLDSRVNELFADFSLTDEDDDGDDGLTGVAVPAR